MTDHTPTDRGPLEHITAEPPKSGIESKHLVPEQPTIRPTQEQVELTALDPQQWPTKVPGDLDGIRTLATRLQTIASNMGTQRQRLIGVDVATFWSGKSAVAFTNYKQQLPPRLKLAGTRYQLTATALSKYHGQLADAQDTAKTAARRASEAKDEIERAGHQVSEWPTFCAQHQAPVPEPDKRHGVTEVVDAAPAGREVAPTPVSPPIVRPVPIQQPIAGTGVSPAFEDFYAALRLMSSAIEHYQTAASTCAASIQHASDDSLKDSSGFGGDLSTLKTELLSDITALAPQLRDQISKLTGVAGMLGLISLVGLGAKGSGTGQTLATDAESWSQGKTSGKKVVDDFLAVLKGDAGKVSSGPVGLDQQGGQTQSGDNGSSGQQSVQGTVPPTQTFTTQGPGGTYNVSIYVGAPTGGATPGVTSHTLPVPTA